MEALQRIMAERTAIVFSHQLNVLTSADKVAVIHDGRVVQFGPPAELLKQDGPLKRMADTWNT